MDLDFVQANLGQHRELLIDLNAAYINWIGDCIQEYFGLSLPSLLGMSIPDYAESSLDKLCEETPPHGIFYIVFNGEVALGMGGLRRMRDGVGENKRIYVSPASRGGGVGVKILDRLMRDAESFGYEELMLESGPFMISAHPIYEAAGFMDIPPFAEAEVPETLRHDWRFMHCQLS
ncbi:MAG: GNAT family N-acetyltransferase [Pseudomonadota bacterium]